MRSVPYYQDRGAVFQADACRPLVLASRRREIRLESLVHGHYPGRKLPPDVLPGVKMMGFWDAEREQVWGLPWHRNEGLELTFLETGSLGFRVEDQSYTLHPDHLTITRPWQRHRVGEPHVQPGRLHWVILDVGVRRPHQQWRWPSWLILGRGDLTHLAQILRRSEQCVWAANPEIRRCFQDIARSIETAEEECLHSRLAVRINELFLLVLELLRKHPVSVDRSLSTTMRTVELFLAELRDNPENLELEWTAQEMARTCGLGVTQFSSHVRRLTNMSPMQHLKRSRLETAAALLRESGRTVTDIAVSCGFGSGTYFSTVFSEHFGCSPREFRTRGVKTETASSLFQRAPTLES